MICINFYVSIIQDIIEYIEFRIGDNLQLSDLSSQAGISDFHFNRMFKTVTGITLKQYVLGRKLTRAMEQLKNTKKTVLDISLEYGFEYPEVFSRAFKRQFGISPIHFRQEVPPLIGTPQANIVERDIINYRGSLALKGSSIYLETQTLLGSFIQVNTNSPHFKQLLQTNTEAFLTNTENDIGFDMDHFYTAVSCTGKDDGSYRVFCGRKSLPNADIQGLSTCVIPEGWYASFDYHGDMFDIREVFIDDLYRRIMVNEAELQPNGIGMLNIYPDHYPKSASVQILVPIKSSV